jgi:alginate O-acetyltransferase complex protein AlgI
MGEVFENLKGMFGFLKVPLLNSVTLYYLKSYGLVFVFAFIASTPLAAGFVKRLMAYKRGRQLMNILQPIMIVSLLLIITGYLVDGSFNPFLYFRF